MRSLFKELQIPSGIISIIGSGGKTTFLRTMAESLSGHILLTTTTHIFPFSDIPTIYTDSDMSDTYIYQQVRELFTQHHIICIGTLASSGKLTLPTIDLAQLLPLADYILVEADGSKSMPLKAHRATEPVIHPASAYTICIAGASGINRPIQEVCHCPEIFCQLTDSSMTDSATPERIALALNQEALADCYFINQADILADCTNIYTLAQLLKKPAVTGSLQKRVFKILSL